jgi:hypothetical protein
MFTIAKRFITTATVAPGLYTSRSKHWVIKEYLAVENEALAVWALRSTTKVPK